MFRERCVKSNPLDKIFKALLGAYNEKVAGVGRSTRSSPTR